VREPRGGGLARPPTFLALSPPPAAVDGPRPVPRGALCAAARSSSRARRSTGLREARCRLRDGFRRGHARGGFGRGRERLTARSSARSTRRSACLSRSRPGEHCRERWSCLLGRSGGRRCRSSARGLRRSLVSLGEKAQNLSSIACDLTRGKRSAPSPPRPRAEEAEQLTDGSVEVASSQEDRSGPKGCVAVLTRGRRSSPNRGSSLGPTPRPLARRSRGADRGDGRP
jgi:hypothetical protein